MSSEERREILQMVVDGKISAEEAVTLMHALEDSIEEEVEIFKTEPGAGKERRDAPEFDYVRMRVMRFSKAFLWIGTLITVLSAWAMFGIQQNDGINFWFYCMNIPLFLGIFLIVMGAGNRIEGLKHTNVDEVVQAIVYKCS